ncbi:unnamed protein product [Fraxinus pennsylvanica]|uniref:Uncharacterized protein n=1 Tax=Fraxinus pennsylvanica TaxID=56036 RepID=A0AAD1ZGX9_9LAMI|nr:unnamed protein product [Fraxinus pennsylvanica]
MGSNGEEKPNFTPKLLQLPAIDSPKHSGTETPPLQTPVSVPFKWEEEPGKPRHCTALIILPSSNTEPKCLELPPRLFTESYTKVTKTPDGPYLERPKFSSFRYLSASPERGELNDMVLGKKWLKGKGFLDSFGLRTPTWNAGKNEVDEGNSVFSSFSSCDSDESANTEVKIGKLRRKESFSSLPQTRSHSPLLAAIYEGLKQVMPWRNRKSKKQVVNV